MGVDKLIINTLKSDIIFSQLEHLQLTSLEVNIGLLSRNLNRPPASHPIGTLVRTTVTDLPFELNAISAESLALLASLAGFATHLTLTYCNGNASSAKGRRTIGGELALHHFPHLTHLALLSNVPTSLNPGFHTSPDYPITTLQHLEIRLLSSMSYGKWRQGIIHTIFSLSPAALHISTRGKEGQFTIDTLAHTLEDKPIVITYD